MPFSEVLPANGLAPKPRHRQPPGNYIDLPVGITIMFLILLSTPLLNLLTKKVATTWGIGFTLFFLPVFVICEHISKRLRKGPTARAPRAVQRESHQFIDP